jgi:hypothetical protein
MAYAHASEAAPGGVVVLTVRYSDEAVDLRPVALRAG